MKKCSILFILILLLIVLASCTDVTVSYRLSDDNTVRIDYALEISAIEENVSSYVSSITRYWSDMGFEAQSAEKSGVHNLSGTKAVECDSRSSAAAQLSSMLTEDGSLFHDAAFTYTPSYFEDNYSFTASVSLKDIIRKNEEHTIPAGEVEALINSANEGEYKLSISLPGEIVDTNADSSDGSVGEWTLKYGEERRIELSAKKVFDENVSHYEKLKETQSKDETLLLACVAASAALLLLIIITLIVRRSRRQRALKTRVERF